MPMRHVKNNACFILIALLMLLISGCSDTKKDETAGTDTNATPLVINGYTLPPEPDPKVNNSTLLGIDSNDNGVRDDVERRIYLEQKKAVDRAVLMQEAKAWQTLFIDPAGDAIATEKRISRVMECSAFVMFRYGIQLELNKADPIGSLIYIKELTLNTPSRMKAYLQYDQALSGGVYSASPPWVLDDSVCDFNVTQVVGCEP
jgi:hypothetical protein